MAQQTSTNTFGTAKWIVSSDATQGTHTTIAGAITSASAGDTVFIRPGTYTENLTLKVGVNLVAYDADALTPNVIILGKATLTAAGTVSISGIQLKTNSDFFLAVTGSAASIVNLKDCDLNCNNNTGISFTTSSSSAVINILTCTGNLATTGIGLFTSTSAGTINLYSTIITNTGGSSTATTASAGIISMYNGVFSIPFSTTSTANINTTSTTINCAAVNATALLINGTGGQSNQLFGTFASGTSSAISVGTGVTALAYFCNISSSNTNAITGAGTINYSGLTFSSSSFKINTTTQSGGLLPGGVSQAPSTGWIGEQVRATVAQGSAGAQPTGTPRNVTSISLTAGIWDVSAVCCFQGMTTGTALQFSISTTSATLGTDGDNFLSSPFISQAAQNAAFAIPSYRLTLTTTTTVYLVANSAYTVGTGATYGRISATRVG